MHQIRDVLRAVSVAIVIALASGCASVKMTATPLVEAAKPATALVTFVRPNIFVGDGLSVDIWDKGHFLGSLGAGNLVQYEAEPGEHLFLANSENWSYTKANLEPGKRYFIKANIFPGVIFGRVALGVAEKTDPRISNWLSKLSPMDATPEDKKSVETAKQADVQLAIKNFEDGKVKSYSEIKINDGL